MILPLVAVFDAISRGNVSTGPDKQIVERQQSLSILELRLGESYRFDSRFACECSLEMGPEVARLERQEDAIKPFRVRVHGKNRLSADVFCRVCYKAILAKSNDQIPTRKEVRRN